MNLSAHGLWVAMIVLAAACPATGQTSSLMRRSRLSATSQPYQTTTTPPLTRGYLGWRRRPVSPSTEALQRVSLTAVVPEPPRSFKVRDLITIIVREQKKYEADAKVDNKKRLSLDAALEAWFRIHDHKWQQQAFSGGRPQITGTLKTQAKNDGKSEREDTFVTRITAEVVDVKPNGNLILEATSYIKNDEEEQIMTLSGVCRSFDVTPDNTVLSTQLGDLRIDVKHTGAVRDATRRGWISKGFDFLRPF